MSEKGPKHRDGERTLGRLYRALGPQDRMTLLAFARFLSTREEADTDEEERTQEPEVIPRPKVETVVGAIKRLSRSYFMLDRSAMLNDTSSLMSGHVLQGRPAKEVIDDLEILFAQEYQKYRQEMEGKGT